MLTATRMKVWVADCDDKPGAAASRLERLAMHGADLQFLLARRADNAPGKGVVFIAPLLGEQQRDLARASGFREDDAPHVVRVESADEPGLAFQITRALAGVRINIRALSAMSLGSQFMAYLAFDAPDDAARALTRLNEPL